MAIHKSLKHASAAPCLSIMLQVKFLQQALSKGLGRSSGTNECSHFSAEWTKTIAAGYLSCRSRSDRSRADLLAITTSKNKVHITKSHNNRIAAQAICDTSNDSDFNVRPYSQMMQCLLHYSKRLRGLPDGNAAKQYPRQSLRNNLQRKQNNKCVITACIP